MSDDRRLRANVEAELAFEPSIDAAHIGVTAKDGVVTLSGFVDSFAARAAAERAAGRVRGVRAIAEEIEVRLPQQSKHADDEIADRALRLLAWDIEVPDDRIKVKVEHGTLTLTGEVAFQFQRAAAEADVRRLGGVRRVVNLIRLTPVAADASLVRQKIESALERTAALEAEGVRVEVQGSHVTLHGRIRSWWERMAAEQAAWAAPGVAQVTNELRVEP